MSAKQVDIQVFGRTLKVNCPVEQQEALNQAAEDLNQRLQDLKNKTKVSNIEQLIFITALNVCHELKQERLKVKDCVNNIEQRINMLQKVIEQSLIEQEYLVER